ncbi:PAS domain-containing protein [Aureimonas sp. AU20]|uniref:PAS domain-containing protein n=1 Tax=Aureimonas sp. AU20 TaxID=1349819 RepID=UPI00071F17C1|nr:PAS domain-containing protein [Aureimonas sp. AU20]ALN75634.1 hypothetical protein M673_23105 [Aureimonas sp. AU20]
MNDSEDNQIVRNLVGIWNWQVSTNLVTACDQVCEYINVPPETGRHGVKPERFIAAIHPDDREQLARIVATVIAEGNSLTAEYRLMSRLHGTRWVRSIGRCFRTANGDLTHISGYLVDIDPPLSHPLESERKEQEMALIDHLLQARDLAVSLNYKMVCALIDATLLETGYQTAAVLEAEPETP